MEGLISAPEAVEIAKHRDDGRNTGIAGAGLKARARNRVDALNGVHGEVIVGIDHDDCKADAVGDVVQVGGLIDPADVEGVERSAGLARGIVLWHRDIHEVGVTAGGGCTARRTVLNTSATVHHRKQGREKNDRQNFRSHGISSCMFPFHQPAPSFDVHLNRVTQFHYKHPGLEAVLQLLQEDDDILRHLPGNAGLP